ncbi:MAG: MoaD/ThiS family protein [Myxococcota bacterium]
MSVTVEVTSEMSKALGVQRFEVEGASTVADAVKLARERFRDGDFETLTSRAAVAVNGVLANHRRGMKTKLSDGDTVSFVKAAAGG